MKIIGHTTKEHHCDECFKLGKTLIVETQDFDLYLCKTCANAKLPERPHNSENKMGQIIEVDFQLGYKI